MEASKKPDPELVESLQGIIASIPDAKPRKMFGCDGFMIGEYFAAGIWRDNALLKLSEDDAKALLKLKGVTPFMPGEKMTMTGWYVLPNAHARKPEVLRTWAERAAIFAASLPPKAAKKPKKKKA